MAIFLTLRDSIISADVFSIDFGKPRTDGLYDVALFTPHTKTMLTLGVESPQDAAQEILRCIDAGEAVDINHLGTNEHDAPNIIRPNADDIGRVKLIKH